MRIETFYTEVQLDKEFIVCYFCSNLEIYFILSLNNLGVLRKRHIDYRYRKCVKQINFIGFF